MANTEAPQPRPRRGSTSWIPAAVAVVTVGLFLGWLVTRQPTQTVAVAEPDTTAAEPGEPTGPATTIEAAALNQPDQYVGQLVEVDDMTVMAALGRQMFWVELPGGAPYLVRLDSASVARGAPVPSTGRVTVVGQVQSITPTLLDEWMQQGVLTSDSDRAQAEFSTTYIQARRVQPAGE